ncbi:hypothetical protein LDDCCGHA_5993 [Methylobacterium oxalidis]|nr:hypothetical protein LDDCCGHA_5993 [Methylobacterium oxalidis]
MCSRLMPTVCILPFDRASNACTIVILPPWAIFSEDMHLKARADESDSVTGASTFAYRCDAACFTTRTGQALERTRLLTVPP